MKCIGPLVSNSKPCILREMHHTDDEGRHWCPTGFMLCDEHHGVKWEIGTCMLWGQKPEP